MYRMPLNKTEQKKSGNKTRPIFTTRQDVKDHIGLSTNATTMTKGQFMKTLKLEL